MKKKSRCFLLVDDKLVLIKRTVQNGVYYVLPGGSVEGEESFGDALIRECEEELGIEISVGNLLYEIVDHFGGVHEAFFEAVHVSGEIGSGADKKFNKRCPESVGYEIVMVESVSVSDLNLLPVTIRDKYDEMLVKKTR